MIAKFIPVEPFDLVVFGGTGDLTKRKILPALYHRDCDGQLPPEARIFAVARRSLTQEAYLNEIKAALAEHVREALDSDTLQRFLGRFAYLEVDALGSHGWKELAKALDEPERIRIFYLATAPSLFGPISLGLAKAGIVTPLTRVVLEKPLGSDLASAQAINDEVAEVFPEDQTYRIDHYLGKETVQNLITLRFANILFEPLWNATAVDHVQITVAESIGVGDRGEYYDKAGALRDMVQNHLLQLLCLVAMEPPTVFDAGAVRDEKLKVLRALKPIGAREVASHTVRGQYRAGAIDGKAVPGYLEEIGARESTTETFVVVKAEIDSWRWSRVPFYLRTGKRLGTRASEIVVQYRSIPYSIFQRTGQHILPNRLVLRLQPDEGMKLYLMSKDPGPGGLRFQNTPLNLSYAEAFTVGYRDAYERLLMDVVRGNPTLFMRKDEVTAAWRWIDPILEGWKAEDMLPRPYQAGSWGPSDATALITRDGRAWHEDIT